MHFSDQITFDRPLSGAPDWAHLIPLGRLKTRDGRRFSLVDAQEVIDAFNTNGADLPIDYEHQNDRPQAKLSGPVPAAGWITALELRKNGIWGRVEWTERARTLIQSREYRYLSPVLMVDKASGEVCTIKGAGLVHNPNLHLTALNNEDTMPNDSELLPEITKLLNLPEDSEAESILEALRHILERAETTRSAQICTC